MSDRRWVDDIACSCRIAWSSQNSVGAGMLLLASGSSEGACEHSVKAHLFGGKTDRDPLDARESLESSSSLEYEV